MNTQGTDGGSVTVALPEAAPIDIRRQLIAMRVKFGAKSMKGRACSTLVELLDNYVGATGWQRANLEQLIPLQMARLKGE